MGALFCVIGLTIFVFSVARPWLQSQQMLGWDEYPAQVLIAWLETSRAQEGGGSQVYQVQAEYRYSVAGVAYTGTRVGLHGGSDNMGDWHHVTLQRLQDALLRQRDITVLVNPDDPSDSVLFPQLRWGLIALTGGLSVVFTAVGLLVLRYRR